MQRFRLLVDETGLVAESGFLVMVADVACVEDSAFLACRLRHLDFFSAATPPHQDHHKLGSAKKCTSL